MNSVQWLWYLQQADFMSTWTKNRIKNRKPKARCRTIMIRHWVVNWRANRLKDVLTRDRTVHYFFSGVEYIWLNEYEKGNTFPFYSHELSAETLCVNCDGQFKGTCGSVQEVTSGPGQKELSFASTSVCEWLYTYQAICQLLFFLAAWSLLTARRAKLYLSWIKCSHLGRQRFWLSSP